MRFSGTINASAGTTEANAVGLDTLFTELTFANWATTGQERRGLYKVVIQAGFIKNTDVVSGSVAGYQFSAALSGTIGEEGDNTSPIYLEVGDWVVLNSTANPAGGFFYYTFSIVNNTYADATSVVKGVVTLSQSISIQDDTDAVITESVLQGLMGTGGTQIAFGDHTHAASAITSGTLGVARGGTGAATFTSGNVLIGAGTGAITSLSRSGIDSRSTFPIATTISSETTFTGGVRTGSGTQSWQIESQAGSNLLFRSGSSPVTRMTLSTAGLVTATTFSGSGASLTSLNASNLSTGTVPVLRLGSGTRSATTYLRGDNTWQFTPGIFSAALVTMTSNGTFTSTGASGYRWFVVDIVASGLRGSTLIRYVANQTNVCLVSLAGSNRGGTIQTRSGDFVLTSISGSPTITIFGVR
jgi:hypothetical protein